MLRKITGRSPSLGKSVVGGLALGMVWTLAGAMILAALVDNELLPMEKIGYGSMAVVLGAVFVGASLAGRKAGHMVIQASILSGVLYFACLILVNVLFFGGSFVGMGVTLILVLLSAGMAVVLAGQGRGKRRRRYKVPKG